MIDMRGQRRKEKDTHVQTRDDKRRGVATKTRRGKLAANKHRGEGKSHEELAAQCTSRLRQLDSEEAPKKLNTSTSYGKTRTRQKGVHPSCGDDANRSTMNRNDEKEKMGPPPTKPLRAKTLPTKTFPTKLAPTNWIPTKHTPMKLTTLKPGPKKAGSRKRPPTSMQNETEHTDKKRADEMPTLGGYDGGERGEEGHMRIQSWG
ncbi:unnamed protein product [Ixodes pacificus]